MPNKGWFRIGDNDGPRTLQEQMLGLDPALAEAAGKTVLDLGCAEGLIAIEFAKAGAKAVRGIECNRDLWISAECEVARSKLPAITIEHADIVDVAKRAERPQYDIVLALAVLHKLGDPAAGIRFCAESARALIVVRLPVGSMGVIGYKHDKRRCADLHEALPPLGFALERTAPGPRGEWVQYWRRA